MVSCHFVAAPDPLQKLVSGCIKSTSLCLGNHFLFGRNKHAQFTTLGLKLMFTILLDTSMHFYNSLNDSYPRQRHQKSLLTTLKHAKPYTTSDSIGVAFPRDEYQGFCQSIEN